MISLLIICTASIVITVFLWLKQRALLAQHAQDTQQITQLSEQIHAQRSEQQAQELAQIRLKTELEHTTKQLQHLQHEHQTTLTQLSTAQERAKELEIKNQHFLTSIEERETKFRELQTQLEQSKATLSKEFEVLANRIFTEKQAQFTQTNQNNIEQVLKPFKEQVDGFRKRTEEIHESHTKGHATLKTEIDKLFQFSDKISQEANHLAQALRGKSQVRGAWGETQLRKLLESSGLVLGSGFTEQDRFTHESSKSVRTDFIVHLPMNKCLIIDSKLQLIPYQAFLEASTDTEKQTASKDFIKSIKAHIDDLASKQYQHLPELDSPSYILMYLPIESAYIDALNIDPTLFQYGLDRNVVLVSHSTLLPILKTVANIWILANRNHALNDLAKKAEQVYETFSLLTDRISKLGKHLQGASKAYNDVATSIAGKQGLHTRLEQFKANSTKTFNYVEPPALETDIHVDRIDVLLENIHEQNT